MKPPPRRHARENGGNPSTDKSRASRAGRDSARAITQCVLREWQQGRRHAAELIDRAAPERSLPSNDRALLLDLVLTVIRHLSLLDHWIGELTGGRELDGATRWLLRAGLAELLLLNMAPHAAVNENVNLAGRAGGLVNAVLRRASREKEALLAEAQKLPPATRFSHPAFLLERWQRQFGTEAAEALAGWNQQPAPVYVRLNRLHPDAEKSLSSLPGLEPAGGDFFLCRQLPVEALQRGWCYAQDPSTALAPELAAAQSGMTVLDACAAPGGKSALLAQHLQNQGRLIACDLPGFRLQRLEANLQRLGVTCAEVRGIDWLADESIPDWLPPEGCDVILLDAPCSNTGVMRRRVDVRWRLGKDEFARLVRLQRQLVNRLIPLLKTGGRLVYSTCSLDAEENEAQVEWMKQNHPSLQLATTASRLPFRDGVDGAFAAAFIRP